MEKRWFRKKLFINRTNEIRFFLERFETIPERILWIYGPKSAGKTTLIEYVIENELFEDFERLKPKDSFWVKYVNLRGKLITNYNTFLDTFIKPEEELEDIVSARINIGILELKAQRLSKVKNKSLDLFDAILEQINDIAKTKKPIIIIDEIQTLQDIYINGEKELIKEFLNFCVRLTKELHLAHVLILSSNTIFIEQIYNDAKLKVTSDFYKIDHLSYEDTHEWLKEEGFKDDEVALIWDYLGGCIPYLYEVITKKDKIENLKAYLEEKAFLAYAEIVDFIIRQNTKEEDEIFRMIAKEILKNGYFILDPDMEKRKEIMDVIDKWAQKEILFYDPKSLKVNGNNRTYEKGMEILLSR
ncbi:MAG: ATP-binding protein [Hydrogenobaculum sp.]